MTSFKDLLPTTITTARLVLATPTLNDVQAIARACNNRNVHRFMSRLPFPYGEDDARFFIENIVPSDGEHVLGIYLEGALIGIVGFRLEGGQEPELGYWLAEEHWGNGYMSEAAEALVAAARKTGAASLRSRALAENTASRGVLRKIGFIEVGEGPDLEGNLIGQPVVYMRLELIR
ncbi:GNAT family N-acetyltransferase [Devosia sp. WQ 349]|uniref:GNAT family N-acetyltransferase n=1 Tax=Devosia sp. WQ 349K1 TaxID=2800329 RepID=UPI0019082F5A|nr:GNAT family N-acetyltransferase [Devosia sp. WQ 349K1]MBK1795529.1 GNAT family N-acetyltransferase [Devosia sp. WQ 349K1]